MSAFDVVGSGAFGAVVGWITYRMLRRSSESSSISDLVTVIAALGGGVVVDTRFADAELFAAYGLGLATGFFGYFVAGLLVDRSERAVRGPVPAAPSTSGSRTSEWMGDQGGAIADSAD